MKYQPSPRLLALFKIGYDHAWDHTPEGDFRGDFVCTYLGDLFRRHNMQIPRAFFITSDGIHGYYDNNLTPHLFHKVSGSITILSQGRKPVSLHRICRDKISAMENDPLFEAVKSRLTARR